MPNLILNENYPTTASTVNLVLDEFLATAFTPSTVGELWWRWEDDPTMAPQLLGSTAAGTTLAEPFDLQGKAIRLFLVSRTATGVRSVQDVREAEQMVFTPDANLGLLSDGGSALFDGGDALYNNS
jgi:hypothetical protein